MATDKPKFPNVDNFLNFLRERNPDRSITQSRPTRNFTEGIHLFSHNIESRVREVMLDGISIGQLEHVYGVPKLSEYWIKNHPGLVSAIEAYQSLSYKGRLPGVDGKMANSARLRVELTSGDRYDGWKIPFP